MFPLHILNTRPRNQAALLTSKLQSLGCRVTEYPLFEIVPYTMNLATDVSDTLHYDVIICTSVNAITHSLPWFTRLRAKHFVAAGQATYEALRAQGVNNAHIPSPCGSTGILTLPCLASPDPGRVLILTGQNSPPYLSQTLIQRGADITIIPTYTRVPNTKPLVLQKQPDLAIVTSKQGLKQLTTHVATNAFSLLDIPLIVVTKAMRKLAIDCGFSDTILVTDRVSNHAILETLNQHMTQLKERL